jgi:hypothetical protein
MLTADLIKDCFIAAGRAFTNKNLTIALLELFKEENEAALAALLDFSVSIADDYLTLGHEYSVFNEPTFKEKGGDVNRFPKWEQLGKSTQSTPLLLNLLAQYKIAMRGGIGGQLKYRDAIKDIVLRAVPPS